MIPFQRNLETNWIYRFDECSLQQIYTDYEKLWNEIELDINWFHKNLLYYAKEVSFFVSPMHIIYYLQTKSSTKPTHPHTYGEKDKYYQAQSSFLAIHFY